MEARHGWSVLVSEGRTDQVVSVGVFWVEFPRDLAVAHHQDAVAQRKQLLGLAGDDEHALAASREAVDDLVDVGAGPDVDPLGGLVEHHEVGIGFQPLSQNDLLLVAAAEIASISLRPALDLVLLDQLADAGPLHAGLYDARL